MMRATSSRWFLVLRMLSYVVTIVLLALPVSGTGEMAHAATNICCNIAKQHNAALGYLGEPSINYTCGQTYSPGSNTQPAPDLTVNWTWCYNNCDGYALYEPTQTSDWAIPLVNFILPAVIFSTQIPRRLGLKPIPFPHFMRTGRKWAAVKLRAPKCVIVTLDIIAWWFVALMLLIPNSLVVILDTTAWVFSIMIGAGPFILGGLVELWLDYKVVYRVLDRSKSHELTVPERIEIFTAILAGNLLIDGVSSDPQNELKTAQIHDSSHEQSVNSLLSMLESQMTFGGAVGAAILLYLGSFVYTLTTLGTTQGDQATARALAFGIWWMTIVHVSVISGSLLASNNPSTAAAIARLRPQRTPLTERLMLATRQSLVEDVIQEMIGISCGIPSTYKLRYEPAWMWSRGKNKALWLSKTSAWTNPDEDREWLHRIVDISVCGWFWLIALAYILVFIPCALAFWIEYRTPPVTVGCRSMTILLYMVAQTIFIVFSAWSHIKTFHKITHKRRCSWLRWTVLGICLTYFPLVPAWIVGVFTTFAGTLMQITGIYQNCACASTYAWMYRSSSTISLATDTQKDRDSSDSWNRAGYSALGVLGFVTLSGWVIQRYIRDIFVERVENLLCSPNATPERTASFGLPQIPGSPLIEPSRRQQFGV